MWPAQEWYAFSGLPGCYSMLPNPQAFWFSPAPSLLTVSPHLRYCISSRLLSSFTMNSSPHHPKAAGHLPVSHSILWRNSWVLSKWPPQRATGQIIPTESVWHPQTAVQMILANHTASGMLVGVTKLVGLRDPWGTKGRPGNAA